MNLVAKPLSFICIRKNQVVQKPTSILWETSLCGPLLAPDPVAAVSRHVQSCWSSSHSLLVPASAANMIGSKVPRLPGYLRDALLPS